MIRYDTTETHAALKGYDHPDAMVTLRAPGRRLTKLVTKYGVESAQNGETFEHDLCDVGTLNNLFDAVADLAECPDEIVVRGAVIETAGRSIRRVSNPNKTERSLIDAARRWVMADLDDLPPGFDGLPEDWSGRDLRDMIAACLPPEFHHAGCVISWSSSMGSKFTKGGLLAPRAHLFFLLDRSLFSHELRLWLDPTKIDASVLHPNQPHFTAAPVFDGGEDLVGDRRVQILEGPRVSVPDVIEAPERKQRTRVGSRTVDWSSVVPWRERLDRWTEDSGEPLHDALRGAALAYANSSPAPDFDEFAAACRLVIEPKVSKADPARVADRLGPDLRRSFDTAMDIVRAEQERDDERLARIKPQPVIPEQPSKPDGRPGWFDTYAKLFKKR